MISFLLSPLGRVLGALVGAAFITGIPWLHGYQRGAASERQAILTRSVEVLRQRSATDEKVRNMDDAGLCAALGGSILPDGSCQ
ncbi:hypothetical protein HNR59_001201 [Aquamicrobium lusatiense]|uniref:Uncharacterized protein n=1 Tax=Aquamicrobium lusatiense TaxID=89772 RepID=A0A7W9S0I8_9HYPH|nr:hypothetical protein [Aquamicrobium lusatiense]